MTTKKKSLKFFEVEVKPQEDSKPDDCTYYFQCNRCGAVALATNGSMLLSDPMKPWEDPQKHDCDYLYCWRCDILENMKDKGYDTHTIVSQPPMPEDTDKVKFAQEVRKDLFK